jgi:hypothetical protein
MSMKKISIKTTLAALTLVFSTSVMAADSPQSGTVVVSGSFVTALNSLAIRAVDCGDDYAVCSSGLAALDFSGLDNQVSLGTNPLPRYVAVEFILTGRLFKLDWLKVDASRTQNSNSTDITVKKIRYIQAGGSNLEGFSGPADLPEAADVLLTGTLANMWDQSTSAQGDVQTTPIVFLTSPTRAEFRAILEINSASGSTSENYQATVNFTWTGKDGTP